MLALADLSASIATPSTVVVEGVVTLRQLFKRSVGDSNRLGVTMMASPVLL
ncbi:MAG: hypothetical protein AAF715_28880 [Myxococcota bacterium]